VNVSLILIESKQMPLQMGIRRKLFNPSGPGREVPALNRRQFSAHAGSGKATLIVQGERIASHVLDRFPTEIALLGNVAGQFRHWSLPAP
jgi:hypothetical protein